MDPGDLFSGHPGALAAYGRVRRILDSIGPVEERTTRGQVAFRHGRAFAFLWRPGQWLAKPAAETVLSIALDHRIGSGRFKEVVHPAAGTWMHHLEIQNPDDLDDEVRAWLAEAHDRAGRPRPTRRQSRVTTARACSRPAGG